MRLDRENGIENGGVNMTTNENQFSVVRLSIWNNTIRSWLVEKKKKKKNESNIAAKSNDKILVTESKQKS